MSGFSGSANLISGNVVCNNAGNGLLTASGASANTIIGNRFSTNTGTDIAIVASTGLPNIVSGNSLWASPTITATGSVPPDFGFGNWFDGVLTSGTTAGNSINAQLDRLNALSVFRR